MSRFLKFLKEHGDDLIDVIQSPIVQQFIPDSPIKGITNITIDRIEKRLEANEVKQEIETKAAKVYTQSKEGMAVAQNFEVLPISTLYRFHYYSTREEYERETGKTCPEFDPKRAPKYWEDLSIPATKKIVLYENTLEISENGTLLFTRDGDRDVPNLTEIALSRAEASTVNIPKKSTPGNIHSNFPDEAVPEIQMPLLIDEIPDGFRLVLFLGSPRLEKPAAAPVTGGTFTTEDRRVLNELLGKVNILVSRQ